MEIEAITDQVLKNCDISDSQHAGFYSICGLALRLRDLYKWEKGIDPWIEKDSSEILEWIEDKEQQWDTLTERHFEDIAIFGKTYDPFDTKKINAVLESYGVIYGCGYAYSLKPTFFLAKIEDKKEIDGHTVYILGRELARDLLTIPALSQDDCVLIRKEPAKLFFWDQILYLKKSGRLALKFALENYGLNEKNLKEVQHSLEKIVTDEMGRYIYHELGEIQDTIFNRHTWREIIATFPHTPIELVARSIKDLLADTNEYGTLRFIIRERRASSLAFYVAFIDGLIKELFPEIRHAFKEFLNTRDWNVIEDAVDIGFRTAQGYAEKMSHIYQGGKQKNNIKWAEKEIAKNLLKPLGVVVADTG